MSEPQRSVIWDLLAGMVNGVALGIAFLAIGAIRLVLRLLAGHALAPPSAKDERMLAFYLGAFAFGGGLVGLAKPYVTSNGRTYVVYALAGAAGGIVLSLGLDESPPTGSRIATYAAIGVLLGCAVARGTIRGKIESAGGDQ